MNSLTISLCCLYLIIFGLTLARGEQCQCEDKAQNIVNTDENKCWKSIPPATRIKVKPNSLIILNCTMKAYAEIYICTSYRNYLREIKVIVKPQCKECKDCRECDVHNQCPDCNATQLEENSDGRVNHSAQAMSTRTCECEKATRSIAISVCVSFLAGILTVLITLFLLRHFRAKKRCFGQTEKPRDEKWEGASQPVTKQVLEQHTGKNAVQNAPLSQPTYNGGKIYTTLDHSNDAGEHEYGKSQATYETLKDKRNTDSHLYSIAQSNSQYESLNDTSAVKYGAGNEHVYTGIAGQSRAAKPYDKAENEVEHNQNKRRDHLFEESRASSASAHNYFTLQNDNFRHSEQSGDEAKQVNEDGQKEGHTYFTLQKDNNDCVQTPEKTSSTENAYFTLEKESGNGELTPNMTSTTDDTGRRVL